MRLLLQLRLEAQLDAYKADLAMLARAVNVLTSRGNAFVILSLRPEREHSDVSPA